MDRLEEILRYLLKVVEHEPSEEDVQLMEKDFKKMLGGVNQKVVFCNLFVGYDVYL